MNKFILAIWATAAVIFGLGVLVLVQGGIITPASHNGPGLQLKVNREMHQVLAQEARQSTARSAATKTSALASDDQGTSAGAASSTASPSSDSDSSSMSASVGTGATSQGAFVRDDGQVGATADTNIADAGSQAGGARASSGLAASGSLDGQQTGAAGNSMTTAVVAPDDGSSQPAVQSWVVVTGQKAMMHSEPSMSAPGLFAFPVGRRMGLISTQKGWMQVQDPQSGATGWIQADQFSGSGSQMADSGNGNEAMAQNGGDDGWNGQTWSGRRHRHRHGNGGGVITNFFRRAFGGD